MPPWPSWLPADGSQGVPHYRPGTAEVCLWHAIVRCDCGWSDPDRERAGRELDGMISDLTRRWVIEMPAGIELLNANDHAGHWGRRKRLTEALREAAGWLAKQQRMPLLDQVRIAVEYQPPRLTRSRDGGNWAPSGKACIDGLRDAGVLANDDSKHVLSETYSIGEPYPKGRLVITITEVLPGGDR
jgi:hypothetical protein